MACVVVAGRNPLYELTAADLVVRQLEEISLVNLKQLFQLEDRVDPRVRTPCTRVSFVGFFDKIIVATGLLSVPCQTCCVTVYSVTQTSAGLHTFSPLSLAAVAVAAWSIARSLTC